MVLLHVVANRRNRLIKFSNFPLTSNISEMKKDIALFLPEAPKGLEGLVTVITAMSAVGSKPDGGSVVARCVSIVGWRWRGWRYTSVALWTWRSRHLTDVRGLTARRGASVSWVDGDAADGIRPSHSEGGEVNTWPMCEDSRRASGRLTAYLL